jgi:hypothetical protein
MNNEIIQRSWESGDKKNGMGTVIHACAQFNKG